MQAVNKSAR